MMIKVKLKVLHCCFDNLNRGILIFDMCLIDTLQLHSLSTHLTIESSHCYAQQLCTFQSACVQTILTLLFSNCHNMYFMYTTCKS